MGAVFGAMWYHLRGLPPLGPSAHGLRWDKPGPGCALGRVPSKLPAAPARHPAPPTAEARPQAMSLRVLAFSHIFFTLSSFPLRKKICRK